MGKALLILLLATRAYAEAWELKLPDRVEVAAGASGTLPIAIALDRGQTISKDAGVILDLAPDGGITVKKKRLGLADAVDPDADSPRFAIAVHGEAAGDFTLRIHLRFWLCSGRVCRPIDARRTVAIAVTSAP